MHWDQTASLYQQCLPLQKMGRKVTLAKVAQHVNEHGMKPVKGKLKGSDFHSSGILHTDKPEQPNNQTGLFQPHIVPFMDRIPTQYKPFSNININHDLKVTQRRFSMVELKTLALKTFPTSCPPMQFAAQGQLWFCKNHHRFRETKNVSRYLLI